MKNMTGRSISFLEKPLQMPDFSVYLGGCVHLEHTHVCLRQTFFITNT